MADSGLSSSLYEEISSYRCSSREETPTFLLRTLFHARCFWVWGFLVDEGGTTGVLITAVLEAASSVLHFSYAVYLCIPLFLYE